MPVTRRDFWEGKKKANVVRDRRAKASLRRLGFRVLTIWECQLRDENSIRASIRAGIATSRR
jgi:DNA mismatch endonuclease (patch repair protein)